MAAADAQFEEGRSASAETLALRLRTADAAWLRGALQNPALGPKLVLILLSNPAVRGPLVVRVCDNTAWLSAHAVKVAIVLHPETPRALALGLVAHLWWRDLVRVVDRTTLAPALRRAAERALVLRLSDLAVGEKISLARIAGRPVIEALRRDAHPGIVHALLGNPRLLEEDVVILASSPRTPPATLRAIAASERWGSRPAVRRPLLLHGATPAAVALRIVRNLPSAALQEVADHPQAPTLVKVAAERTLRERGAPKKRH